MDIDKFIIQEHKTLICTLTSNGYKFMTHNLILHYNYRIGNKKKINMTDFSGWY